MAKRLSEFSLIEKYFAPLSGRGSFGLKDDAAILDVPKNKSLVVTNDAIAESVHFLKGTEPKRIAQKAIRTNISDLAAKGASPFAFSLALGLPKELVSSDNEKWIKSFAKGLALDCKQYGLNLCGGDTFTSASGIVVSITAYGHINKKDYASRLGVKSGHALYVTGSIGDAVIGLQLAVEKNMKPNTAQKYLINRYELPRPRVEAAKLIAKYASASMDISDGLVGDLEKLCVASSVSTQIELDHIPLSKQVISVAKARNVSVTSLITGGDDYELLIAIPKAKIKMFERESVKLNFPVTRLGSFDKSVNSRSNIVTILDLQAKPLELTNKSYKHF